MQKENNRFKNTLKELKKNIIPLILICVAFLQIPYFSTINMASPDPYFHLIHSPTIYWVGFITTIFIISFNIYSNSQIKQNMLLTLFLLFYYTYVVPILLYKNKIYTDTYIFLGELLYVLNNGNIGWGHSDITPALSLLSAQFSILSSMDLINVAELFQFIIPLLALIFLYTFTKYLLINEKAALISIIAYMSGNWMNHVFHFNRQSLGLSYQIFIYFLIWYFFIYDNYQKSIFYSSIILLISYFGLVIIHSFSSALVSLNLILITLFLFIIQKTYIFNSIKKYIDDHIFENNFIYKMFLMSISCTIIWIIWSVYTEHNITYIINTIQFTINRYVLQPNPIREGVKFISGYTESYYPIILTRTASSFLYTLISIILTIYISIKNKINRKTLLLSTWLISCFIIFPTGLWTGEFIDRGFLHIFIVFSIISSWFITKEITNNVLVNHLKTLLLILIFFFTLVLPLTKYSNTPFMYPPDEYLEYNDYLSKYGYGQIAELGQSSVTGYYILQNNRTVVYPNVPYNISTISEYNTITTTFRYYSKETFTQTNPEYNNIIKNIEEGYVNEKYFNKALDLNNWHKIYNKYK